MTFAARPQCPEQTDLKALINTVEMVTLPAVTLRIFQIIRDPNAGAEQLSRIVRSDPPLCARMLRVVNSAQYGLPRQVHSIERAVALLGFRGLKRILIAANLYGLYPDQQITDTVHVRDLWIHSNAVAAASRLFAERLKLDASNAYLAGLIHDLVIVMQMQVRNDTLATIMQRVERGQSDFLSAERRLLGFDHTDLGQAICDQWGFPEELGAVTRHHHQPLDAPAEHRTLCAIVYLSDLLAARNCVGYCGTVASCDIDPAVLEHLNLDDAILREVEQQLLETLDEAD